MILWEEKYNVNSQFIQTSIRSIVALINTRV